MATAGAGLLWSRPRPETGIELTQPLELPSNSGALQVRLEAAQGNLQYAGRNATILGYNGAVPGPTLRLRAGDTLSVDLHNKLNTTTNLHVHGLHVSPEGTGDNVFVAISPGSSHKYEYRLPEDHPPGTYWYHPHHHGLVADQISGGLFGAIIVEDPETLPVARERVLIISDVTLDDFGQIPQASPMTRVAGREGESVLVNGQLRPQLSARPGERERWRFINACVSRYLHLRLEGQEFDLLGIDQSNFEVPRRVNDVLLAPGNRADLLIQCSPGSFRLEASSYDRGMPGMMGTGRGAQPRGPFGDGGGSLTLAVMQVSGDQADPPDPVAARPVPRDLRLEPIAARRSITFEMGMGAGMMGAGMGFTINGRAFDPGRSDTTVTAGSIEEWTLVNSSPMDHPFHLHVWPMQVINDDGQSPSRSPERIRWQDVVNVPSRGRVTVRIDFSDYTGRSVYHCHILDHEDLGMMGTIEVR